MRVRIGIALAGLACASLVAACGITGQHSVEGTIESVNSDGPVGFRAGYRYIMLEGNKTVYVCSLDVTPACGAAQKGQHVTMQVGYDNNGSAGNNAVASFQLD